MSAASDSPQVEASLAALDTVPRLRTAVVRLTYRTLDRVHLPSPPANVWRGQLGHFLHHLAPKDHHEQDLSLYQRLFRTPASAVGVPDYDGRTLGRIGLAGEHVPHPFVIRMADPCSPGTSVTLSPGETAEIEMVLIETTVQHLPSLAAAFEAIGDDGFGQRTEQPSGARRRGRISLTAATLDLSGVEIALYDGTSWSLPPTCGSELYEQAALLSPGRTGTTAEDDTPLSMQLVTPCRLKHGGRIVKPSALTADALAAALARRVLGLAVCYGPETPTETHLTACIDGFYELADATTVGTDALSWTPDTRYNHRQNRSQPVGGLTGRVTLHGDADVGATWRRWLRPATRVHLGKGTAMGHGRLRLGT
jgi:hypothetical protein